MTSVIAPSSRITVAAGDLTVDLAVPDSITVAELLTTVVDSLDVAGDGAADGGWVLQPLGRPPLEPAATVAASRLTDGTVLHLRTRGRRLAPLRFDDLPEAVAKSVSSRTSRWTDHQTRRAALVAAAAVLLAAAISSAFGTLSPTPLAVSSGTTTVVLLALAVATRHRDVAVATVAASSAVLFAALAGLATMTAAVDAGSYRTPVTVLHLSAWAVLGAATGVVLAANAARALLRRHGVTVDGFVGAQVLGTLLGLGALIDLTTPFDGSAAGVLLGAAALSVNPLLPTLALRIARVTGRLDPDGHADVGPGVGDRTVLGVDDQAVPGVGDRAVLADQMLTGLVIGAGGGVSAAAVSAVHSAGSLGCGLAIVLGCWCLVRARAFTGIGQRAALLVAGGVACTAAALGATVVAGSLTRVLALTAMPVLAAAPLVVLVLVPAHRAAPSWSRVADVVESLLTLAAVPLTLAVAGVFGMVATLR